jgi:hypothetical protein
MGEILIVGLIVFLIEFGEHYFPWKLLLRKRLPRVVAYMIGVLGLVLPLGGLFIWWQAWECLIALGVVIGCGGGAVLLGYGLDHAMKRITLASELEELMRLKDGGKTGEISGGKAGSL